MFDRGVGQKHWDRGVLFASVLNSLKIEYQKLWKGGGGLAHGDIFLTGLLKIYLLKEFSIKNLSTIIETIII